MGKSLILGQLRLTRGTFDVSIGGGSQLGGHGHRKYSTDLTVDADNRLRGDVSIFRLALGWGPGAALPWAHHHRFSAKVNVLGAEHTAAY